MSPKLAENIQKGLKEQSKMVHLDSYHQGEVVAMREGGGERACFRASLLCPAWTCGEGGA